jgi:hypothetical protein
MDQNIVGVIDAQGYYVNNRFHPVELAAVGDGFSYTYRLFANLNFNKMTSRDQKQCRYVKNKIHGISLYSPEHSYSSDDVDKLILRIHLKLKQRFKKEILLGCKNNHLAAIMDTMAINYVNLTNTPSLKELDKLYGPWCCSYHTYLPGKHLRCSLRKCAHMWKWVKQNNHRRVLSMRWKLVYFERVFNQSKTTFKSLEDCFSDYISFCKQGYDVPDSLPLKMMIEIL